MKLVGRMVRPLFLQARFCMKKRSKTLA